MATATQPAISAEFAAVYRDLSVASLERELQTTKKVIAAVPDAKRDYRPDPKARTAWDLAFHIASVDVQFADEIVEGKFSMEPRLENKFKSSAELAAWYEKEFRAALERAAGLMPQDGTIAEHLGDAYSRQKRYQDALRTYRRALTLENSNPPELRQKIKQLELILRESTL